MYWSACSPNPLRSLARWPYGYKYSRTLFTLPKFSDFAPSTQQTQTYHERKLLPYGQKELYDIVSDVGSYYRFIPFCTGSRIISLSNTHDSDTPSVMEAELTVGFLTFKEKYTSQVTCIPYQSVQAIASSSTPLFKTLSTTWRFQPASAQSPHPSFQPLHTNDDKPKLPTLVTLDLAYAFANPIHASISSAFFGQVSGLMVKAFEQRCLDMYGPGLV